MANVEFNGIQCVAKKSKYMQNDGLAVMLFDKNTGETIAVATVNTGDNLPPNVAVVKTYSENTGMLSALKDAGLIVQVLGEVSVGYKECPLVQFNLDALEDVK